MAAPRSLIGLVLIGMLLVTSLAFSDDEVRPPEDSVPLRRFNVRLAPIGLIIGSVSADVNIGIADATSIGVMLSYFSIGITVGSSAATYTALAFGAQGRWFASGKRFTDSFFISPYAEFEPYILSGGGSSGTYGVVEMGAVLGYGWFFRNGFNLSAGAGASYKFSTGSTVTTPAGSTATAPGIIGVAPALEFSLGFAF